MSYTELKSKAVKCRKKHVCEWCGERIAPGEQAQYRAYVFDCEFNNGYMHPDCNDAMLETPNSYLEYGFEFGQFNRGERADHWEG